MRGSRALEYMNNDVVWTSQASSAAGVDKRCPSVLARVWWYFVSPMRVVASPIRESGLCALVGMLISVNVLTSAGSQKGRVGEFGDGSSKPHSYRVKENGKSRVRV
jgi:hypothetical protein